MIWWILLYLLCGICFTSVAVVRYQKGYITPPCVNPKNAKWAMFWGALLWPFLLFFTIKDRINGD